MARSTIHFMLATVALFLISSAVADYMALTPDNFEKEVGQDRDAFVEFYTPWCGHCKKLAPEFERIGASFKKIKSILIAKVDCESHKELCTKHSVTNIPSLKWFPKGSLEAKDYDGVRTAEAIIEYVNREGGTDVKLAHIPSNVVVLTTDNFNEIVLDKTKHVLVKFYTPWCGHCLSFAPVYESLVEAYKNEEDVVIACINLDKYKEPGSRYDVIGYPTIKLFTKDNKDGEDYEGAHELDGLVNFLNEKCGTSRDWQGQLTSTAGIIEIMDTLVKEFMRARDDDKEDIYAKIEEEAGNLDGSLARYGKIYLKAAHSCMAKGADYARNEIKRLERLLSKSISSVKADEFQLKKNILSSFSLGSDLEF